MSSNVARVFSDVLSLDAWHDPFRMKQDTYGVFVELSFKEGRVGGDDPDLPFTFNVSLRKALLTIKLEEPLVLDRTQVARGIPHKQAEHTQVIRAKDLARQKFGVNAKVSPDQFAGAFSGGFSKEKSLDREEVLRVVQAIPEILVTPVPEGSKGYSWEIEPLLNNILKGQPWDPISSPRMRVFHNRESGIDPSIKVEVRCALEDIHITSLIPKDQRLADRLASTFNRSISEAAAIQHLKKIITRIDLYPGELDNRFNSVIIADVLAMSS